MKTKTCNKAIIYDDNCPMCQAYTKLFVSTGFLQEENRIPFSKIHNYCLPDSVEICKVDWQRARHEIPVIDKANGKVFYGIDALAEVLNHKIFFIKPMLDFKPVRWFFLKLYKLISYNRKIIVANHSPVIGQMDASPDYSLKWRLLFIAVVIFLSGLLISVPGFGMVKFNGWIITGAIIFVTTAILFLVASHYGKKLMVEIIAQIAIVSLIACLFLNFFIFFKNIFSFHPTVFLCIVLIGVIVLVKQFTNRFQFLIHELKR